MADAKDAKDAPDAVLVPLDPLYFARLLAAGELFTEAKGDLDGQRAALRACLVAVINLLNSKPLKDAGFSRARAPFLGVLAALDAAESGRQYPLFRQSAVPLPAEERLLSAAEMTRILACVTIALLRKQNGMRPGKATQAVAERLERAGFRLEERDSKSGLPTWERLKSYCSTLTSGQGDPDRPEKAKPKTVRAREIYDALLAAGRAIDMSAEQRLKILIEQARDFLPPKDF
ncbi:MAG: hypothetical protein H6842_04695 [Rhodospirillaceae bacterium]|nr:hypothetical protein [Rhodospirillaceae bacterium]